MFTSFKYLGRVLTAGDDDWISVVGNLKKVQTSWARLTRILVQEGENMRVSGMFFNAVVHVVLIFWSETWLPTHQIERALGSFQHKVARRITWRQPGRQEEG